VDIAIINEAQQVSKEYGDMLIPTIRNEGSELWWIWNPENEEDWVHQTFIVKTRPDTILQMVNYPDNLKCPKVLINEAMILKDNDYEEYRHIWLGELKPKNKGWRTFNPDWLDFAAGLQENKPKPLESPRLMSRHAIGSDPAFEGVDSWVTIEGKGNKVLEIDVILKSDIKGKRDTDLIADNINGRVMRAGRFNCDLGVDGNGPGQGVCDRLEGHYGFKDCLNRLNKKDKDFDPPPPKGTACPELSAFTNWRAQAWWLLKIDLEHGNIDLSELARSNPKEYALLVKEILAHNIWTDENKKMHVTPKAHLRKKEILGWSPGRADALVAWNWVRKRVDDYVPERREREYEEGDYMFA
jgi:phage terminase large subunit